MTWFGPSRIWGRAGRLPPPPGLSFAKPSPLSAKIHGPVSTIPKAAEPRSRRPPYGRRTEPAGGNVSNSVWLYNAPASSVTKHSYGPTGATTPSSPTSTIQCNLDHPTVETDQHHHPDSDHPTVETDRHHRHHAVCELRYPRPQELGRSRTQPLPADNTTRPDTTHRRTQRRTNHPHPTLRHTSTAGQPQRPVSTAPTRPIAPRPTPTTPPSETSATYPKSANPTPPPPKPTTPTPTHPNTPNTPQTPGTIQNRPPPTPERLTKPPTATQHHSNPPDAATQSVD